MINLTFGYQGTNHVSAQELRDGFSGIFGEGNYVLAVGEQLAHEMPTANRFIVKDGAFIMQGTLGNIPSGSTEEVAIENGDPGQLRNDFIVIEYNKNGETQAENFVTKYIRGIPTTGTPQDPVITTGAIRTGSPKNQWPIKRIRLNGINVLGVDDLTTVNMLTPSIAMMNNAGSSAALTTAYNRMAMANYVTSGNMAAAGNVITIGKNTSLVKVTAWGIIQTTSAITGRIYIYKNNAAVSGGYSGVAGHSTTKRYETVGVGSLLLPVKQGDIIDLRASISATLSATYLQHYGLTVERIK
ncbi:MAG: hypothetical protein ACRCUS_06865 [Anaerovoracaceae bacterium]